MGATRYPVSVASAAQRHEHARDSGSPEEAGRWLLAARPLEDQLLALGVHGRVRRRLALEILSRVVSEKVQSPEDACAQAIRELDGWSAQRFYGDRCVSRANDAKGATAWHLTMWLAGRARGASDAGGPAGVDVRHARRAENRWRRPSAARVLERAPGEHQAPEHSELRSERS